MGPYLLFETSANPPEADCAFSFPLPWWEGEGGGGFPNLPKST